MDKRGRGRGRPRTLRAETAEALEALQELAAVPRGPEREGLLERAYWRAVDARVALDAWVVAVQGLRPRWT